MQKSLVVRMPKWLGWIFFALPALVVGAFVLYVRVNTVAGISTGIRYEFTPLQESLKPIHDAVASVAVQYRLHRSVANGEMDKLAGSWGTADGLFSRTKPHLAISFEAHPAGQSDARKQTGYLTIYTLDTGQSDEWLRLAKVLEDSLRTQVKFEKVDVGLDPSVYGACASNERPTQLDSICTIPLASPVDFEGLKSMLERQRAARR
jgi:hypothetical protein